MILVTGHLGFIGKHLTKALDERGLEWRGFDLREGHDIRDKATCEEKLKDIDTVVHLAALAGVGGGQKDPDAYILTNTIGTLNLLKTGPKHFIFFSSASVYGDQNPPNSEVTPTEPTSLYGMTKLTGEMLVKMSGIPYTIVRPFNVYGENGRKEQVIYKWAEQSRVGPIEIRGDGNSKRGYTYVGDLVDGIINVIEKRPTNDTYNFGSEMPVSLNEVANLFDVEKKYVEMPSNEIKESWADSFKAQEMFGFSPKTIFADKAKEILATLR